MARRSKTKLRSMRSKVKTRAQERESTGGGGWLNIEDGTEFFTPEKGRNVFDVLPYVVTVDTHPVVEKGEPWFQRTVWVHYNIGADEKSYICPMKTIKKKCPICEHRANLMKDPDADDEILDALKPKEREVFNVRHNDDIKLFTFSYHLFGKQLEEEIREGNEKYAGFADLEGGSTLKTRFSEKKLGKNKFFEVSRIDFEDKDDEDESILDDVYDLDKILKILPYGELEKIYYELNEDKPPEEEEKTTSKSKGKSKKSEKKEKTKTKEKPKKEECPEGLEIGTDFDQYDSCDGCEVRSECEKLSEPEPEPKKKSKPKEKPKPKEKTKPKCEECPEGLEMVTDFDQYQCCDECECRDACSPAESEENDEEKTESENDDSGSEESECPYDHEFGKECNDHSDCDECDSWEACQDAKDQMEDSKSKKKSAKGNTSSKEKAKGKKKPIKKKK